MISATMADLVFDGEDDYVEVPDAPEFSIPTTGQLSISAWIRPDVLTFPAYQSTGYVHWMGKGEAGQREWVFRIYNQITIDDPPRPNRISFYVFNLEGGEGIGSYFQDALQAGEWIHVVGVADEKTTAIYKNGEFRDCDRYRGKGRSPCHNYSPDRWIMPARGTAPLRIGTEDLKSFFLGAIRQVRVWSRALRAEEITRLYGGDAPSEGLVAEYLLDRDIAADSIRKHDGLISGATWVTKQTTSRRNHNPDKATQFYTWAYPNVRARTSATGFVTADVGQFASQTDDHSIWMLTSITPTWTPVLARCGVNHPI